MIVESQITERKHKDHKIIEHNSCVAGPGEWEPEIDESQEFITKHDPVLTCVRVRAYLSIYLPI